MSVPSGAVYFPPPPPSPSASPSYPHGQRRQHQPVQPPAISTDVGQRYGSHLNPHAPASAVLPSVPFSPAQAQAPMSAMSTYNPQEWGRGSSVAGQYVPHAAATAHVRARSTRDATGMETHLPEPPPPYSASASPNTNNNSTSTNASARAFHPSPQSNQFAQSLSASPIANSPNANIAAAAAPGASRSGTLDSAIPPSATQAAPPMSFPPPPGSQRDRSSSRTRGVLSNLAAFASSRTRASDNASPANATESYTRQRGESISRTPASSFRPVYNGPDQIVSPAGARRSASVGFTQPSQATPSRDMSRDRSTSNDRQWDQGMPLPGPPPGPPPSSRSQSMNRVTDRSINASPEPSSIVAPIPTRAARGSTLGPVPPTPADWVDEEVTNVRPSGASERTQLRINTQNNSTAPSQAPAPDDMIQSAIDHNTAHSSYSTARIPGPPGREPSLSIRDRRNEARARSREPLTAIEAGSNNSWLVGPDEAKPANLVLSSSSNSGLSRRRHVAKAAASPRSGAFSPDTSSTEANDRPGSSGSAGALQRPGGISAPTPPFSPASEARESATQATRNFPSISSKSLPTPPTRDSTDLSSATSKNSNEAVSRLDASPLASGLTSAPLSSAPLSSARSFASTMSASGTASKFDDFARTSLQRFERFLESEVSASDDQEKLELFAEFVVNESRLRRDRYSTAFENMGSDVLDLTRDLWRSYSTNKRQKAPSASTPSQTQSSTPGPISRSETGTPVAPSSTSSPGSAGFTPGTEPESPGGALKYSRSQRGEGQRQGSFQPMLSPIPSMAMSTVPDESDSRGRAPSRWWEQSDEGSFGAGGRKIERSKRESKYMGLPREAREHLQWDTAEPSPGYAMNGAGPSNQYQNLGPNEYPPEKVGWHDDGGTPQLSAGFSTGFLKTPTTPQPRGLDVSRLITLPPPFPRHHPAVNNSHPELSSIRANLRTISDTEETKSIFERYASEHPEQSPVIDPQALNERRREMRMSIQNRVATGEMSFTDAAKAEATFEDSIVQQQREAAQKNFDDFQNLVLKPLSGILNERISNATSSIDSIHNDLLRAAPPDETQEEGDEKPELLEKVTLMKWLFEARETLHKELWDLQNKSDEKYKHVILAPYRVSANEAKIAEVEEFFDRDYRDRISRFNTKIVKRFETFLATVEETVARGVEAQLSAFWDIAPGLLAVVQKVPTDETRLHTFDIQIPQRELVENPPYVDFPLQYLYTLLLHAEKSAYQFIESQTNLLCLLHEVKTGLMLASCRLLGIQRTPRPGETAEDAAREMDMTRRGEDERLTRELKEKVDVVEDQWRSALGTALGDCKIRVGAFLVHVGGWDDSLEE